MKIKNSNNFLILLFICFFLFLIFSKMNSIEHLFSPGPLTEKHSKYENDCSKCHYAFKKKQQNDLCLECHNKIAQDLKTHLNFHGRSLSVNQNQCTSCHTDHKGKTFDIKHLDKKTFNHNITGFILSGAHSRESTNCETCHLEGKEFREASIVCFGCHAKNDSHKGSFGKDCAACHNETIWSKVYFNHNQKTNFKLSGKHIGLQCASCHKNNFKKLNTDSSCYCCHKKEDIHKSLQGAKCE